MSMTSEEPEKEPDKTEPNKIQKEIETYNEVQKVMEYLGRKHSDGAVRGDNLSKVLRYLIFVKQEEYGKTVSKLSLICGMMSRYVRENYLQGIEDFGFIRIYFNSNKKYWEWIGLDNEKGLLDFLR